jgi:acyl-CoA synthetase (AMP-forming)/AMP-acid ligase II
VGGAKSISIHAVLAEATALGHTRLFRAYGLSEAAASVVAVNTPKSNKPGSVGRVLPPLELSFRRVMAKYVANPGCLGMIVGHPLHHADFATADVGPW